MSIEHTPGSIFGSLTPDLAARMADLGPSASDEPVLAVPPDVKIIGHLGDFHIFDVRHGGMGEVYLCVRDKDEQRLPIALKSFKPELQFDPVTRRAFQREYALWTFASIVPGIVPVHGMIEVEGRPFIIMTGVLPGPRGETNLCDLLRAGPLALDETVFFASAIAKWLSLAAHVVPGLVHGDLTPANVLIRGGVPWISDFGLARIAGRSLSGDTLIGTKVYCSPLARDPKALLTVLDDVYSFGVMLEQMVTGVIPGRRRLANRWHISASNATTQVRDGLLALAQRCQAKDPALRPYDFKVISDELKHLTPEDQWPKPDSACWMPTPTPTPTRSAMVAETLVVDLEEYGRALQFIATATDRRNRSWRIWQWQGVALSETGDQRKALRCYRRALLARWNGESDTEKQDTDMLLLLASVAHMRLGRRVMLHGFCAD